MRRRIHIYEEEDTYILYIHTYTHTNTLSHTNTHKYIRIYIHTYIHNTYTELSRKKKEKKEKAKKNHLVSFRDTPERRLYEEASVVGCHVCPPFLC